MVAKHDYKCNCKACKRKRARATAKTLCSRFTMGCQCSTCVSFAAVRSSIEAARGKPRTVFEAIQIYGHDEDFQPQPSTPTTAPPGTTEKVAALRKRIERGQELWHDDDVVTYDNSPPGVIKAHAGAGNMVRLMQAIKVVTRRSVGDV